MKLQTAVDEFLDVARFSYFDTKRATVTLSLFLVLSGNVEMDKLEPGFLNVILKDEAKKRERTLHFFLSWCVRQGYIAVLDCLYPRRTYSLINRPHSLFITRPPAGYWRLS